MYPSIWKRRTALPCRIFLPHGRGERSARRSDRRGLSLRAIARALGRAASTISREIRRNALDSGGYRPHMVDGAYMLRRQRRARLETEA